AAFELAAPALGRSDLGADSFDEQLLRRIGERLARSDPRSAQILFGDDEGQAVRDILRARVRILRGRLRDAPSARLELPLPRDPAGAGARADLAGAGQRLGDQVGDLVAAAPPAAALTAGDLRAVVFDGDPGALAVVAPALRARLPVRQLHSPWPGLAAVRGAL